MKRTILFLVFLMYPVLLYADIVYFYDGTSIEGQIIKETEASITIRVRQGPAVTKITDYPKSRIAKIEKGPLGAAVEPEVKGREEKSKPQGVVLKKIPKKETVKAGPKAIAAKVNRKDLKYKLVMHRDRGFIGPLKMNRIECTIAVPNYISKEQLKAVFLQVLREELDLDKDLDALWIVAHTQGQGEDGIPKAYGIWSPPGGWDDFKNKSDKSQYKWDYRFLY